MPSPTPTLEPADPSKHECNCKYQKQRAGSFPRWRKIVIGAGIDLPQPVEKRARFCECDSSKTRHYSPKEEENTNRCHTARFRCERRNLGPGHRQTINEEEGNGYSARIDSIKCPVLSGPGRCR